MLFKQSRKSVPLHVNLPCKHPQKTAKFQKYAAINVSRFISVVSLYNKIKRKVLRNRKETKYPSHAGSYRVPFM